MKTPDYTALDAELIALIKSGVSVFTQMVGKLERSSKPFGNPVKPEPFRVVDRRLQALKKKNLIAFSRAAGWSVVKVQDGQ